MEWYQILLAISINALWIIPLVLDVIIYPLKESIEYNRIFYKWNSEHPDLLRKRCMDCKYCKKETNYIGRYPHGYPERYPVYCRLLKRRVSSSSQRCQLAEPTSEFIEAHEEKYPAKDTVVYFSAYGDSYHSTPLCSSLKQSVHIRKSVHTPTDRKPCSKCWVDKNNTLYPRK